MPVRASTRAAVRTSRVKLTLDKSKRRVKCDETGPPCKKCVAMRLQCEGMGSPSVSCHPNGPSSSVINVVSDPNARPDWRVSPADVEASREEIRVFDRFRKDLIHRIGGPIDKPFWTYDILQGAQASPCIWHSCLAIAATVDNNATILPASSGPSKYSTFALKQYSLTLAAMKQLMSQKSVTYSEQVSVLLSCILLSGLSGLMLNRGEAVMHADYTVRIYQQWGFRTRAIRENDTSKGAVSGVYINGVMASFELHLFHAMNEARKSAWTSHDNMGIAPCSDLAYRSSTEAYYDFEPLFSLLQRLLLSSSYPSQGEPQFKELLHNELRRRKGKLEKFQKSRLYDAQSPSATIIRLQSLAVGALARVCLSGRYMDDPQYVTDYTEINDLMDSALQRDLINSREGGRCTPTFTFSSDLSYVAAIVMMRCPSRAVVKRMIDLMAVAEEQDNFTQSTNVGRISKAIFDWEQSFMDGAAADSVAPCACIGPDYVCNMHRVVYQSHYDNKGDSMIVRLLTQHDIHHGYCGTDILVPRLQKNISSPW